MKWKLTSFLILLSISFVLLGISQVNADLVSFNYGGDSNTCISNGIDTCNLNYIPTIEEPPSNPPPTSSVTYSNITNKTFPIENKTEPIINQTKIIEIENEGKKINIWIYILIGIISLLILICSVIFDISKRKLSKDGIMFVITCLIFGLIALVLSIYYKSIYSSVFLILIVLIFMSIVIITIVTKDHTKGLEIFGVMFICLISLIFSGAMILIKNYVIASITIIISVILIIISVSILIDNQLKKN